MMKNILNLFNALDTKTFYTLFDHAIEPIVITDANLLDGVKILFANRVFCTTTGYTQEELIGKSPKLFQGKDSNHKILRELKGELLKGNDFVGQSVNYKKDGSSYIVKWSILPLKDKNANTIGYISFQKVIDKEINLKHEKLLSSIVSISTNLILVTDIEGIIVYTNDAFCKKLGYSKEELLGKHTRILKSGKQDNNFYKKMWRSILKTGKFSDIFISRKKDNTLFYDKKDISTLKDDEGNPVYYVSISRDITHDIQKQKTLEEQVFVDTLTTLYNRKKYNEIIEQKIKTFQSSEELFSLILIDIDFFKNINDTYGHDIGDYVLQEFSSLLKNNTRDDDVLFRWGGEEFAILVNKEIDEAYKLAKKLRESIAKHNFQSIKITASFGISQINTGVNKQLLFNKADHALYQAKQSGRDKVVYDEETNK